MNIGNQYASTLALINSYVIRLLLKLACVKHLKYIRHFSNIKRKRQLITSTLNMCLLHIISQLFDCFILAMLAPKILSSLCKSIIHRVKRMNQLFFFFIFCYKTCTLQSKNYLVRKKSWCSCKEQNPSFISTTKRVEKLKDNISENPHGQWGKCHTY